MLSAAQLNILFELSMSLIEIDNEDIDYNFILKKLVRPLNCIAGQIYFYTCTDESYDFELIESLPQNTSMLTSFLKKDFLFQGQLKKEIFERKKFPISIEFDLGTVCIFNLPDIGLLVLHRNKKEFDELFLRTLNKVVEKVSILIKKNRVEKEIEASEHLASIGQITSGIAHEINNPLSIISISNKLIQKSIEEINIHNIVKYNDMVVKASTRIQDIVACLQSLSRSDENIVHQEVSVSDILHDCKFFVSNLVAKNHVEIDFPQNIDSELKFYGNSIKTSQVLINLIKNAIEEVQSHENPWVKVTIEITRDLIFIKVIDSGLGIPEPIQKKLMTPFFTTKDKGKGTGIGLALSKKFVESQGGSLKIAADTPNTTFIVSLKRGT